MSTTGPQPERRLRSSRQLNFAPRAADLAKFPADFGTRFTVCIYVQDRFDRKGKGDFSPTAISHIPEFQRLAEAHGVIPTYLLNYPAAMSREAHNILAPISAAGHCLIGAQLQPWLTPPFDEEESAYNSYAGNLPEALEQAKLDNLTAAILSHFGHAPTIYRAGRFGVGPNTAQILCKAGYRMDVSVRPRFDFRADGGPDFTRHDARPFWAGPDATLLALPVGACFTGSLRRFGRYLQTQTNDRRGLAGLMARSNALQRIALTPEDMPIDDVKAAVRTMTSDGIKLLNFTMHAPSLVPGLTPYVQTSADLNELYRWWDDMFGFLAQLNIRPIAADAVIAAAWSMR